MEGWSWDGEFDGSAKLVQARLKRAMNAKEKVFMLEEWLAGQHKNVTTE